MYIGFIGPLPLAESNDVRCENNQLKDAIISSYRTTELGINFLLVYHISQGTFNVKKKNIRVHLIIVKNFKHHCQHVVYVDNYAIIRWMQYHALLSPRNLLHWLHEAVSACANYTNIFRLAYKSICKRNWISATSYYSWLPDFLIT